jgi:ribosome-associated protein
VEVYKYYEAVYFSARFNRPQGRIFAGKSLNAMIALTFQLKENTEFIPLDKLLKLMRLVGSGGEAHKVIEAGMVKVNGNTATEKRKKMRVGDKAEFNGQQIEVQS